MKNQQFRTVGGLQDLLNFLEPDIGFDTVVVIYLYLFETWHD
jgi:hypothetical protein